VIDPNRIEAWIRLRDSARFDRDARRNARSVKEIGDEAEKTAAKLALMEKAKKKQKSLWDELGFSVNKVSGRFQLLGAVSLLVGPGLVSIGSSAAGAAVGLGLLGGTALSSLLIGLGGIGLLASSAVGGLDDIRAAQEAYNLALAQYGDGSKQAATAQAHLNAVVSQKGGPAVLALSRQIDQLKMSWRGLTGAGRDSIFDIMENGLSAANSLLPTFARESNASAAAVSSALAPALQALSGPEMQGNISSLGQTFRGLAGPAINGVVDLLMALLNYARAAGPYVVQSARGFASWAASFRTMSGDSERVGGQVSLLVTHTRAWVSLLGALGGLLVAVFGASEASGLDLVNTMTAGVDQFTAWINAARESGDAQKFFAGYAAILKQTASALIAVVGLLGQLTTAALPGLQVVWDGVNFSIGAFADLLQFLSPLIPPIVVAFAAWKAATIALTAATWALNIAFRLTPLGWIVTGIAAVVGAVIMMYNKWDWFRNAVNGIWSWMKTAAIDTAQWIIGAFQDVISWIKDAIGWMKTAKADAEGFLGMGGDSGGGGLGSILKNALEVAPGIGPLAQAIPGGATGTVIPVGGSRLVGEQGPELAWNQGGATVVKPLGGPGEGARSASEVQPISGIVHVHSTSIIQIDRRELGRAMADEIADARARR
jgi:hypothetical protein